MPAASPGIYQALGMHLESTLVLPELIQAAPSVEREALVQVVERWSDQPCRCSHVYKYEQ